MRLAADEIQPASPTREAAANLFAMAAVLAALFFGLAALIGAVGHLISVIRARESSRSPLT
ncbi:MAG: hypothetical protein M1274_00520 [Actinobacteria bacterium]|nr:hypothetical protein [Actinomycetota bacterium]